MGSPLFLANKVYSILEHPWVSSLYFRSLFHISHCLSYMFLVDSADYNFVTFYLDISIPDYFAVLGCLSPRKFSMVILFPAFFDCHWEVSVNNFHIVGKNHLLILWSCCWYGIVWFLTWLWSFFLGKRASTTTLSSSTLIWTVLLLKSLVSIPFDPLTVTALSTVTFIPSGIGISSLRIVTWAILSP